MNINAASEVDLRGGIICEDMIQYSKPMLATREMCSKLKFDSETYIKSQCLLLPKRSQF